MKVVIDFFQIKNLLKKRKDKVHKEKLEKDREKYIDSYDAFLAGLAAACADNKLK